MDGKSHLAVGIASSALIVSLTGTPNNLIVIPIMVGAISSIAPDLDHRNSILVNKVVNQIKWIISIIIISLVAFIIFHSWKIQDYFTVIYITGFGILFIFLYSSFFKPKIQLFSFGVILLFIGSVFFAQHKWLIFLSIFIMISSIVKHRGLTHSFYALGFWSIICYLLEIKLEIRGIWLAGTGGYLSHLVTDHYFSKTKINWLKPREVSYFLKKVATYLR